NPANIEAYVALAQIALHEGRESESLTLLNSAIQAVPNDPAPRLALVAVQISRRKYDDAHATLDVVLKMFPDHPQALSLSGQLEFFTGNPERAVEIFRGLAAAYPYSSSTYVLLAKALNATKDRLAAIDAARRAVELSPYSTSTRLLLIEYMIAGGRSDQALE